MQQSYPAKLSPNVIIETPTGKFIFTGRCDARLLYQTKDGQIPSNEKLEEACRCGPRLAGLETRVFNDVADALNFEEDLI